MSVLFLSLRGGRPGGDEQVDLRPVYLLLILLAAAMTPPDSPWYYPALAGLALWALWPVRPKPTRIAVWLTSLALALALGYGLSLGLQRAHGLMADVLVDWMVEWFGHDIDPYKATTAIGEIGDLKMSERIVLRVRPEQPLHDALLLRSASYNRYFHGRWLSGYLSFKTLEFDQRGWVLAEGEAASKRAQISLEVKRRRGMLPLPGGSLGLNGLEGATLSRNALGAVKLTEAPALAQYRVRYGARFNDAPPDAKDLHIPPDEVALMQRLADEWGLSDGPPDQALRRLQQRFLQDFRYSLRLETSANKQTALAHFLLQRRAGHCEYFASAAALLLRAAGIPTRYALGWSVQEYSGIEQAYVARARHAHSWTLVWIDGAWRDFDPTPPDWSALEAQGRPFWGVLQDLWSRLAFLFKGGEGEQEGSRRVLIWLLPPLLALLLWRVARRGRRLRRHRQAVSPVRSASPFAAVETAYRQRGAPRRVGESLREWAGRIEREGHPDAKTLQAAIELHYRIAFDPTPCSIEEEQRRRQALRACLQRCLRRPARQ
jgi:hypothetical protein